MRNKNEKYNELKKWGESLVNSFVYSCFAAIINNGASSQTYYIKLLQSRRGFFCLIGLASYIRSFQPDTSEIDYIESKTKLGGNQKWLSMLQIPFIISFTSSAGNVQLTTSDLICDMIID